MYDIHYLTSNDTNHFLSSGLFIHGNQGKTRTQVEDGVEGVATDVLIPPVPLYLVLMILPVLIQMESEFLVSIFMSSKNCYHIRAITTRDSYFVQPTFL